MLRWMIDASARDIYAHAGVGGRDVIFFASMMGHHSDVPNAPTLKPERVDQLRSMMRQAGGWICSEDGRYKFMPREQWDRFYVEAIERAIKRPMSPEHTRGLRLAEHERAPQGGGAEREMAMA